MVTEEGEKYWELFNVSVEKIKFKNLELGKIYVIKIPNSVQVLTLPNTIKMADDEFLGIYTGHFEGKQFELFNFWKYSPLDFDSDGNLNSFYPDGSPYITFGQNYDNDKGEEAEWLEFETSYHPSNVNECLIRLPKDYTEIYLIPEIYYSFAHKIFWEWREDSLVREERLGK
jgi:hypothetical protein